MIKTNHRRLQRGRVRKVGKYFKNILKSELRKVKENEEEIFKHFVLSYMDEFKIFKIK